MGKKSRNIALGTLFIGLAGYAVGVLTAPKSGRATRKDVHRKAARAKSDAEKKLKSLHSELNEMILAASARARKAKSKVGLELSDALGKAQLAREKARKVLSALHEGDAEDRELRRAIREINSAVEHLKRFVSKNV